MIPMEVLHFSKHNIYQRVEHLSWDDRKIVAGYLQGDGTALKQLDALVLAAARPYQSRLELWWDDLLQDIRLKIYELFLKDGFRGQTGLKTYVWKMVNHTCIDYLRKHQNKRMTALEDIQGTDVMQAAPSGELRSTAVNLGLLHILEKVPENCRKLWQMILAGLDYRQMSQKMALTEEALRVRVYRCRKKAVDLRRKAAL